MNGIALIAGMIIAGIALLAVLGTVIAVVIVRLLVKGSPPEEVLRQRYAKGETTRDQYEQMRQDLETNATGSASDLRAPSRSVIWLSSLVAVLALLSTIVGLFSQGGPGEFAFRTVRGETVQMYGHGIYRYDTLFQAAINRGTDAVTLVLGIPLLVVSVLLNRGGSLRGRLLLTSALASFLYVYTNVALSTAYNNLFLVYVALFAASLFALALAVRSIDLQMLASRFSPHLPRRAPAIFMFAAGVVTAIIWLSDVLPMLLQGQPPKHLDSYTTMVTYVLDLVIIIPASILAGFLLLRRSPLGYLIAFALLGIIVLLAPAIVAQTVSQLVVGVSLTPGEILGPVVGFVILGLVAIWLEVSLLRNTADTGPSQPAR
jgi:hypothetical protein